MHLSIFMLVFCLRLFVDNVVVHGVYSTKKGVCVWSGDLLCGDMEALKLGTKVPYWVDWRTNSELYQETPLCSDEINAYESSHVPMIWGKTSSTEYNTLVPNVLLYNEPNHKGQSNMTPQQALTAYLALIEDDGGNIKYVSPSAAKCGGDHCNFGNTTTWFAEFFDLCGDACDAITTLATHTYWCSPTKTMLFLKELHETFNKDLWLTEVACAQRSDVTIIENFMKGILPLLEEADYVIRYFWYKARITEDHFVTKQASLFHANNSTLNDLGQWYVDYEP